MVGFVGALPVPFSSGAVILSHTPLPARKQQPSKLIEILDVHATFSEVIGSRLQLWVLLKFQVVCEGVIGNTLILYMKFA